MFQSNDRGENEVLCRSVFSGVARRPGPLLPSVARIPLVFFEHVAIALLDASLFRRLDEDLLKEDEDIREQTTFELRFLRGQIRE